MLRNKRTHSSIRSRITTKGRRMRALLSSEGLRKSKNIQPKRKGWGAIIEAPTIPQNRNLKTTTVQDDEGFMHVPPGRGAKPTQPPSNPPKLNTNETNPFSILAHEETVETTTNESNNTNINRPSNKDTSTKEPINVKDTSEFPPLIGNSFESQRKTIKAIIRPQVKKNYPNTFKSIMDIIMMHDTESLIQWIEEESTVDEMSHAIAKQFGNKSYEMASILEHGQKNVADDNERSAAIERLRLLCNLVPYNSIKVWPSKEPTTKTENGTTSDTTEDEEPIAMRGGNNSGSEGDEGGNNNTEKRPTAKKKKKKTKRNPKAKTSSNNTNTSEEAIPNPYNGRQTNSNVTPPNQHKMKQTVIHSFTKLDNGDIRLPKKDEWPIRGKTETYPNLFPSVRLSSLLKHSYATDEPKVRWATLMKLEDNDKVRLLITIIHDTATKKQWITGPNTGEQVANKL